LWLCSKCFPPEVPDVWSGNPQDKGLMRRVAKLDRSNPDDNWGGELGHSFTIPDHDTTRKKGQFQQIAPMGDENGVETRPITLTINKARSGSTKKKIGFSLECYNEDGTMPKDVAAAKDDPKMANKISKVADDGLAKPAGVQANDFILYVNGKPTTPGKSDPGMAHNQIVQAVKAFSASTKPDETMKLLVSRDCVAPAYTAGIRAGDVILEVNGKNALNMSRSEIIDEINTADEVNLALGGVGV
jgi:hypothetical protein